MLLVIRDTEEAAADWAANYVIQKINAHDQATRGNFVLGLPTGSSPLPVYQRLIAANKEGRMSFKNVETFNMDEYVGLPEDHPQSFHYFMDQHLFKHIDIPREQIHFLDGNADDLCREAQAYEDQIRAAGGVDLFMAGVGVDGHLAFNEPGSSLSSRTRDKDLTMDTIVANSRFFDDDIDLVPKKSLTVGVGTIMDAREVLVIATGYKKARVLSKIIEDGVNHMWPASMLQLHARCMIVCDDDATMELRVGTAKYFKEVEIQDDCTSRFSYRR